MVTKVYSLFSSLFSDVNLGVKRLLFGGFFIVAVPLLIMAIYYTVKQDGYAEYTDFRFAYIAGDARSKGEFDHYNYLRQQKEFFINAFTLFCISYLAIISFSLWVWQGFKNNTKAV